MMLTEIILAAALSLSLCYIFILKKKTPSNGQIVVSQGEDGKKMFSLELDKDPEEIENMKSVTFDVSKQAIQSPPGITGPDGIPTP